MSAIEIYPERESKSLEFKIKLPKFLSHVLLLPMVQEDELLLALKMRRGKS